MESQSNPLITEFFARSMQVVLESRIPAFTPTFSHHGEGVTPGQTSKFNILLGKFGPLIDKMEPWCRGVYKPMVVDIWYSKSKEVRPIKETAGNLATCGVSGIALAASGSEKPILLERWTIEFVQQKDTELYITPPNPYESRFSHGKGAQSYELAAIGSSRDRKAVGKGGISSLSADQTMVILIRSLYCTARLLPSQSLFRLLSTAVKCKFKLSYKVSASPPALPQSIRKDMLTFCFTPVECHDGLLCVSVAYRKIVPVPVQETSSLSTRIILDYVSNAASYQLKQFPNEKDQPSSAAPRLSLPKFCSLREHIQGKTPAPRSYDPVGCKDFSNEVFDCPFAVDGERDRPRMESGRLRSMKLDSGGASTCDPETGPLGSVMTLLRPAAPLSGAQQDNLVPMKTAADALKELKLYIDLRDSLLK